MDIPLEVIKALDLYISEIKNPDENYGVVCSDDHWYVRIPCISRKARKRVIAQINWDKLKSYLDWTDKQARTNFSNIEDEYERTFHSMCFSILGDLYLSKKIMDNKST